MRPIAPSLPAGDDITGRRLVIRDGSVASVRPATEADLDEMRRFFRELSPKSHYRRFLSAAEPADALLGAADHVAESG